MYGIENTQKVLDEVIEAGNIVGEIAAKPKELKWYEKVTPVLKIMDESVALLSVDWKLLGPEIKDITSEEKAQLIAHFVEKFDIPQDKAEAVVEKLIASVITLTGVVVEIIEVAKELKNPAPTV